MEKRRHVLKKFTNKQEQAICDLYIKGMSSPDIARKFNTTHTLITRYLIQNNIKIRPKARLNNNQVSKIVELYNNNISISKISKKFNLSYNTIQKYLKKENVKLRSKSETLYKGSRFGNGKGYINVCPRDNEKHLNPGKHSFIAEHRLVMARYLGRPLKSHENVHHKNGVKTDNRLCNLELWSTWQPAGQRVLDKIKWAKDILKSYKNEVKNLNKLLEKK